MSDSTTGKMFTLKSKDGGVFMVPERVAKQSETIRRILENPNLAQYFPIATMLPKYVTAPILAKVLEYCWKHAGAADVWSSSTTMASVRISYEELRNWDRQFVDVDQAMLCDLTMAANFLNIKGLQHALFMKVVDIIMGNRLEENWQFLMKWANRH